MSGKKIVPAVKAADMILFVLWHWYSVIAHGMGLLSVEVSFSVAVCVEAFFCFGGHQNVDKLHLWRLLVAVCYVTPVRLMVDGFVQGIRSCTCLFVLFTMDIVRMIQTRTRTWTWTRTRTRVWSMEDEGRCMAGLGVY